MEWRVHHMNAYTRRRHGADVGRFTFDDYLALFAAQGWRCLYCHAPLTHEHEIDHVVPLVRGGSNCADNLALACVPCNRAKNGKIIRPGAFVAGIPRRARSHRGLPAV